MDGGGGVVARPDRCGGAGGGGGGRAGRRGSSESGPAAVAEAPVTPDGPARAGLFRAPVPHDDGKTFRLRHAAQCGLTRTFRVPSHWSCGSIFPAIPHGRK